MQELIFVHAQGVFNLLQLWCEENDTKPSDKLSDIIKNIDVEGFPKPLGTTELPEERTVKRFVTKLSQSERKRLDELCRENKCSLEDALRGILQQWADVLE